MEGDAARDVLGSPGLPGKRDPATQGRIRLCRIVVTVSSPVFSLGVTPRCPCQDSSGFGCDLGSAQLKFRLGWVRAILQQQQLGRAGGMGMVPPGTRSPP